MNSLLKEKIEQECHLSIARVAHAPSGSIAQTARLVLSDGRQLFAKWGARHPRMFPTEANSLSELRKAKALAIPAVHFVSSDYLIMERVETGRAGNRFFEHFGRALAGMHGHSRESFGFFEDNFIGHTPQENVTGQGRESTEWSHFYLEKRLRFQLRLAEKNGYASPELIKAFSRFESVFPSLIAGTEEPPALLHGDLWSGNFLCGADGRPWLIDPAAYYGHREAELGMTTLFGGFPASFYQAYDETCPLQPGWRERLPLYELYHLFNHLNLFGSGYYASVLKILQRYS